MGLFDDEQTTYVDSTAYNLAGPLEGRPNMLQTAIAYSILSGESQRDVGMGMGIVRTQLSGPRAQQQNFFRWSKNNFAVGRLSGNIGVSNSVDPALVVDEIDVTPGNTVNVAVAFTDKGDSVYWAKKHILETRPEDYDLSWISDYDSSTQELVIQYPDTSIERVAIASLSVPFDSKKDYVVAYYRQYPPDETVLITTGETVENDVTKPPTTGKDLIEGGDDGTTSVSLSRTETVTVDDGVNPPESTVTTTSEFVDHLHQTEMWESVVYRELDEANQRYVYDKTNLYITYDYAVSVETTTVVETVGGVTTTTTVDQDIIDTVYDHRTDESEIYSYDVDTNRRVFLYQVGSGTVALDALVTTGTSIAEFFPVIPLRINNKPITHGDFSSFRDDVREAYDEATGQSIDEILATIDDNPQVGDIDYAYMVHGVELNTVERAGLRYLYEFFQDLKSYQALSTSQLNAFLSSSKSINNIPTISKLVCKTASGNPFTYSVEMQWLGITEEIVSGIGTKNGVPAKKGELWWTKNSSIVISGASAGVSDITFNDIVLNWQDGADSYKKLRIYGLRHVNQVYQGNAVTIYSLSALNNLDESGFIVPLHYDTLRKITLSMSTQLSVSNRLVVFNSYEVVTTRWYEKTFFRILLAVVIAVVVALVNPAAGGILGANLAIGSALGLSGTAAIIAGAVANAVAAMALSYIINVGATALFGEKYGPIVAAIITFFAFQFAANYAATGSMNLDWGNLMRAENLIKLTDAVAGGAKAWAQAEIGEMQGTLDGLTRDYETRMDEIEKKTLELLGYSGVSLDPLMLAQARDNSVVPTESSSTFLGRTLMTGPDIASASFRMISDFSEITLTLPTYTT